MSHKQYLLQETYNAYRQYIHVKEEVSELRMQIKEAKQRLATYQGADPEKKDVEEVTQGLLEAQNELNDLKDRYTKAHAFYKYTEDQLHIVTNATVMFHKNQMLPMEEQSFKLI